MSTFRVRTSQYNTVDLQDLGASLSQFINTPTNQTTSITLTPSQILALSNTNPIFLFSGPSSSQYYLLNSCTTELLFSTGNIGYTITGGLNQVFYTYGTNSANVSGLIADPTAISSTGPVIGFNKSNGLTLSSVGNMLGSPIYLNTNANNPLFINGNSNVKLIFNYATYNYP